MCCIGCSAAEPNNPWTKKAPGARIAVMKSTLTASGMTAVYDGLQWSGDEPLVSRCEIGEAMLGVHYYPNPVKEIAESVAETIPGAKVEFDPEDADMTTPPPGRIY